VESRGIEPSRVAVVFGAMRDKSWEVMLERLRAVAVHRFYVEPRGRAPASVEELRAVVDGRGCGSVAEAIEVASSAVGAGGLVVVCGSLFLVAEARALLLDLESDPMVAL
jgi:dihydrofolate synthase/folylpolyglutamate synthase